MAQINIIDYNKIVYFDENTGNYKIFDGERWWLSDDKFGTSTKPSGVALVDSAIVDKSVVGEEEKPAMVTIWYGTFSGIRYITGDVQNASLLRDAEEVTVTFDGVVYTATVTKQTSEDVNAYTFGASDPSFSDYPFSFSWTESGIPIIGIIAQTDGEHTIKVEYTPSPEPTLQTIWEGTFTPTERTYQGYTHYEYVTDDIQKSALLQNISEVNVTYDGTEYKLPVGIYGDYIEFGSAEEAEPPFSDYPFYFSYNILVGSSDVHIGTSTAGSHTLKVEGTPSGDEPSDLITLYDGTLPSGHYILENGFWRFDIEESDLDYLSSYTDVTITRDNLEPVKLPVQVNGRYYGIAGGDAYPPTELTSPPSVMAAYQLIDGNGKAMIITENLGEDLAAYPHIKVQADPDDKRKE